MFQKNSGANIGALYIFAVQENTLNATINGCIFARNRGNQSGSIGTSRGTKYGAIDTSRGTQSGAIDVFAGKSSLGF